MFLGFDIEKQNPFHLSWQFNREYTTKELKHLGQANHQCYFSCLECLNKQKW